MIKKKLSRLQKYNPSIYCDESAQCKSPEPWSNNQKIATVENGKLSTLALEGKCMQSKSAVTTDHEVTIESYSCRTCIHPEGSLQKSLNILPTQEQTKRTRSKHICSLFSNKMESSKKIPTLELMELNNMSL